MIQSDIYDRGILQKTSTAVSYWIFLQKYSTVDVWLVSKHTSDWEQGSGKEIHFPLCHGI